MSPKEPDPNNPLDLATRRASEVGHPTASSRDERWFRSLVENVSDVITILEADGTIRYVSPAVERVLGYRREELVGTSIFDLVHSTDIERGLGILAEVLETTGLYQPFEFEVPHKDGSWRYIEHVVHNMLDDPSVKGIMVNSRDVTERKHAYDRLAESERRFSAVVSSANAYVYRCLNEPGYPNEFASDYALELTGYPPEDLLVDGNVRFGDLIVEEDRSRVWEEVQKALTERRRFDLRYTIRRRDGAIRHVQEYGQGVSDQEGNVVAIEGLVYDVTELVETERGSERARSATAPSWKNRRSSSAASCPI
jgi:PAS domain S-box-containing protein